MNTVWCFVALSKLTEVMVRNTEVLTIRSV
jgi:hypothetical protein